MWYLARWKNKSNKMWYVYCRRNSNPQPSVPKTDALPLRHYSSLPKKSISLFINHNNTHKKHSQLIIPHGPTDTSHVNNNFDITEHQCRIFWNNWLEFTLVDKGLTIIRKVVFPCGTNESIIYSVMINYIEGWYIS